MTIKFRNGTDLKISNEVANLLKEKIFDGYGHNDWQVFSDENGNPFLFLNLKEIYAIVK